MPQPIQGEFPQAFAIFPGVNQVLGCSFTLGHGITPSSGILRCVPQAAFTTLIGSLVFTYPGMPTITLPNCLIDQTKITRDTQGMIVAFSLLDRRWLWRWPTINGCYNVRMEDGTLAPLLQQTPQNLATLCLLAMGESNFDVSQLPNVTYPQVNWENENAAKALQDLCEELGCRIVLTIAGSGVAIVVEGSGVAAPPGYLLQEDINIKPPETPDFIGVACGPNRYQVDFPLQAVGRDLDGTIKPIEKLSYAPNPNAPDGGWSSCGPPFFDGLSPVEDPNTGFSPRDLAMLSVFRWYQIAAAQATAPTQATAQGPVLPVIPGYGPIVNVLQILPLDSHQVTTYVDQTAAMQGQQQQTQGGQSTGIIKSRVAEVYGIYYAQVLGDASWLDAFGNTFANQGFEENPANPTYASFPRYTRNFSIDAMHGVVMFDQPVYQRGPSPGGLLDNAILQADLVLRTACNIRNFSTWDLSRNTYSVPFNQSPIGTGTQVLHHDEIILQTVASYSAVQRNGPGNGMFMSFVNVQNNAAAVNQEATYYTTAEAATYQTIQAGEYVYTGLKNIELDGFKQQITWNIGNGRAATTSLSVNNEFDHRVVPYRNRRIYENVRGKVIQQLKKLAREQAAGGLRFSLQEYARIRQQNGGV